MKEYFPTFYGNFDLRERMGRACASNRLSHAHVISGANGCGKKYFAYLIIAADCCEHKNDDGYPLPCSECRSCKKILGGNSPDVTLVSKPDDRATISVDTIRELRQQMYVAPNELKKNYYVIDSADAMTPQAQNALLKNLEEPPSDAMLFLLCENVEELLPTIRSRTSSWRIPPLAKKELEAYLTSRVPRAAALEKEELEAVCISADGSIGRAEKLLLPSELEQLKRQREDALKLANLCAKHGFDGDCAEFIKTMPQKRESLKDLLSLTLTVIRDMTVLKKSASAPLCFFTESQRSTVHPFGTGELTAAADAVLYAAEALDSNANITTVMLNLLCGA